MKNLTKIAFLFIASLSQINAGIILSEGFESISGNYTITGSFNDGSDDYFIRTDGSTEASGIPSYTGFTDSYFWAAEDTESASNASGGLSSLEWNSLDISGMNVMSLSIDIGAGSQAAFDATNDYVSLQYRVDNGSWIESLRWEYDGSGTNAPIALDENFDGIGEGAKLDLDLSTFSSSNIPVSGTDLDLKIELYLTSGDEAIAFDNIVVTAIPEPKQFGIIASIITFICCKRKRIFGRSKDRSK